MSDKQIEFRVPEVDDTNLNEHIFYASLRNILHIPNKKYSITIGRVIEIPLYSWTRLLKYQEHIGLEGVFYEVRYSYKGKIKDKIITRDRFIKAYKKWYKKCWLSKYCSL